MDRWSGVIRVSLNPNTSVHFRVAASLCLSPSSKTLTVPSANAIFFKGDRVERSGNAVVEKLSDARNVAEILVSKLGVSVNAWVLEASTFNGPFAVYKEFVPSVNSLGEPKRYDPDGFPAASCTSLLLSKCLEEVKNMINGDVEPPIADKFAASYTTTRPKTIVLGFSKGGTVLNQLVTELAHLKPGSPHIAKQIIAENTSEPHDRCKIIPTSIESFLNSISEFHYVDVGLNSSGAYLTDNHVIEKITERVMHGAAAIRFALHGTPRQWCDVQRPWIQNEKNILLRLLEEAANRTAGKIQVRERFYFAGKPPNLQMHFEVIERLDIM